jgi:hypothetical protein
MRKFRNLPGAALAVGAFVLTLMLGFGGAAASALWQQSATVAMTVTWPAQALTVGCTNDSPQKVATLTVTSPSSVSTLTYSALQPGGTYGPAYNVAVGQGITNSVALTTGSQIIQDNKSTTSLTIRFTASFANGTQASGTVTLTVDSGNSAQKIVCPA